MNAVVNVFKVNKTDNGMPSIHTVLVLLFMTLKKRLPAQPGKERVVPLNVHFRLEFLQLLYCFFFGHSFDSPVNELSSTAAFPFMIPPSKGIFSPAHTRISVPILIFSTGSVLLLLARTAVSGVFNITFRI